MTSIAIIPARGGSKRIPRKNIKLFMGKPIIAYVIEIALASNCFDEVMVSTDDHEIAEVSRAFGASTPFMRSPDNSSDHATTLSVLREVMTSYCQQRRGFDLLCCLYPTAVLSTSESVVSGKAKLLSDSSTLCTFPVVQYGYPLQRALRIRNDRIHMLHARHRDTRSQDLEKFYHDAGQWYWLRALALDNPRFTITGSKSSPVIVNEQDVQDIDTESDWHMAELKFYMRRKTMNGDPAFQCESMGIDAFPSPMP